MKTIIAIVCITCVSSALEVKKADLSLQVKAMQTVKIDMSKAVMKPTTIIPIKVK